MTLKHNISNKPKADFTMNASLKTLLDFILKTVEWDEGFKEELQQQLREIDDGWNDDFTKTQMYDAGTLHGKFLKIVEILGENSRKVESGDVM